MTFEFRLRYNLIIIDIGQLIEDQTKNVCVNYLTIKYYDSISNKSEFFPLERLKLRPDAIASMSTVCHSSDFLILFRKL